MWIDIDASLFFNVSATGKVSKHAIQDNTQSEGRCDLKYQGCRTYFQKFALISESDK